MAYQFQKIQRSPEFYRMSNALEYLKLNKWVVLNDRPSEKESQ